MGEIHMVNMQLVASALRAGQKGISARQVPSRIGFRIVYDPKAGQNMAVKNPGHDQFIANLREALHG